MIFFSYPEYNDFASNISQTAVIMAHIFSWENKWQNGSES
jgi:hypothetical protein